MSIIVSSNHTRIGAWVTSKISGRNPPVYCTIPLIAMQGYQTKTEDTISLDYNSICYITSRVGWVSMKGIFKYRCRRDPGKLSNNYCYMYLTKDKHPPSNLLVCSTIPGTVQYHRNNDIMSKIVHKNVIVIYQ